VRPDDFLIEYGDKVRVDLLEDLRRGPLPGTSDIVAAFGLLLLIRENFEQSVRFAHTPTMPADHDMALALRTLRAVLRRVGIDPPALPFRDYSSLEAEIRRKGWENAAAYDNNSLMWLADLLEPIAVRLEEVEEEEFQRSLAEPVSPSGAPGWRAVDEEIAGLRSMFAAASTAQQFANVGNACVRVLERAGDVVHDLVPEPPLPRDKSKERMDRFVEARLPGPGNAELRKLSRAAVELAHRQKHRTNPTRRDVGITADAAVLVVNMLRRLAEGEVTKKTSMHA
jgi:hypothetical protein